MVEPAHCPLLDAVVRDHEKYREAREMGRRAARETITQLRETLADRLENLAMIRRLRAEQAAQPSRPALSFAESLKQIADGLRLSDGTL